MSDFTTCLRALRGRAALALAVAMLAAVVVAGCGGDDSSGSSGSSSSSSSSSGTSTPSSSDSGSSGVAAAKAAVEEFKKVPQDVGISGDPITKPIPTGKKIVYIYCGAPICNVLGDGAKKAAEVLGWTSETIPSDGTPESVKKAWQTAVRMKPAAVLASGFNTPVYKAELEQLKAMNIPVFNYATTDPGPSGGVTGRIGGPDGVGKQGEMEAAWVVADTDGKANTLFVDVPAYAILQPVADKFDEKYKEWCPDCPLKHISLPITSLGKDAVQRVISYLRANPKTNYVVFSLDAADVGLPAALKAAGLQDKVKYVGASGSVENLAAIERGEQAATINQGYYEEQAALVDAAVRYMLKLPYSQINSYKIPYWIDAQDNLTSSKGFEPQVPDLYGKLATLWGKK